MSSQATSGAKGFAIIFGAMVGIIGLLWLVAWLVAPS
jgi:flagellar biogenesis protein FliO